MGNFFIKLFHLQNLAQDLNVIIPTLQLFSFKCLFTEILQGKYLAILNLDALH